MDKIDLIKLAYALINDAAFKNTSVNNIIHTIQRSCIYEKMNFEELKIYLNIVQRKRKLIEINKKYG